MSDDDLGRIGRAVADTLGALRLGPEYAGLAALATELAVRLDRGDDATYAKLTPRLAGVLRELGATPAPGGRPLAAPAPAPVAELPGGDDDDERDLDGERELDELGERRRTRADRAAGMD